MPRCMAAVGRFPALERPARDPSPVRRLGPARRRRVHHAGQRHALHPDRPARRDRGVLGGRAGHRHLRLFRGLSGRRARGPAADPPRRPCAGVRGAGQLHVGRADRPDPAGRAMGVDAAAAARGLLHVGHLCRSRKLAEQRRRQREPRQAAVGLHDRADAGDHRGAGAADAGRRRHGQPVHRGLDPGVGLLRADPAERGRRAGRRCRAADVAARAVRQLAARHGGHLPAGQPLRHAIGDGRGVRHRHRVGRGPDRAVRRHAVRRRAAAAIPVRLAVRPHGPAQADLRRGAVRGGGRPGGAGAAAPTPGRGGARPSSPAG